MRRFALILAIGFAFGLTILVAVGLVIRETGTSVAGPPGPSGNGDVNGDGTLGLADAVYLLNHLFQMGPEPVSIVPSSPCPLAATGAIVCADNSGQQISCDDPDFPGQDAFYQIGCPTEDRFEIQVLGGDEVILDHCTGLMWQRETASVLLTWQDALIYCDDLGYAGVTDWRLPNIRELHSLAHYGVGPINIDPVAFPDTGMLDTKYWSSNTSVQTAAVVQFQGATISYLFKSSQIAVRAVRGPVIP